MCSTETMQYSQISLSVSLHLSVQWPVHCVWCLLQYLFDFPSVRLQKIAEYNVICFAWRREDIAERGTTADVEKLHTWDIVHCVQMGRSTIWWTGSRETKRSDKFLGFLYETPYLNNSNQRVCLCLAQFKLNRLHPRCGIWCWHSLTSKKTRGFQG